MITSSCGRLPTLARDSFEALLLDDEARRASRLAEVEAYDFEAAGTQ